MLEVISPGFSLLEEICLARAVAWARGLRESLFERARASAARILNSSGGERLGLLELRLLADAEELSHRLGSGDVLALLERLAGAEDPFAFWRDLSGRGKPRPDGRIPLELVCPKLHGLRPPWDEIAEAVCGGLSVLEEEMPGLSFWVRLARDVLGAISRATAPLEGRTAELVREAMGLKEKRVFCAGCSPVAGGAFVSFEFLELPSGRGPVALVRRAESAFLLPLDLLGMAAWERGSSLEISGGNPRSPAGLSFRRALRVARAEVLLEISRRIGPRYASLMGRLEGEELEGLQEVEGRPSGDLEAALGMIERGIPPVQLQSFEGEEMSARPLDPLSLYEAFARSMGRPEGAFCDLVRVFDVCAETLDLLWLGG